MPDERGALAVRARANGLPALKPEKRSPDEEATCAWVLAHGQSVKLHEMPPNLQKSAYTLRIPVPGTAGLPGARRSLHLLPLKVGQKGVGVLRLQVEGDSRWLSAEAHLDSEKGRVNSRTAFFWTFLDQAILVIEQERLRTGTLSNNEG